MCISYLNRLIEGFETFVARCCFVSSSSEIRHELKREHRLWVGTFGHSHIATEWTIAHYVCVSV